MSPLVVAQLISLLGTRGLPLIAKLIADHNAGKTQTSVTPEDLLELYRLSNLTAAEIFAKQGVKLPEPASPTTAPAA